MRGLLIIALLAVVTTADSTTENSNYTQFDLFKNTGFAPCPINSRISADASTTRVAVSRWVRTQYEFCANMAGTPIIIPTTPSQIAFFPWYPTYLLQAASLSLSYLGLWHTTRRLTAQQGLPFIWMPRLFWIQLPFDGARVIAFLFKAIHGFIDKGRFPWINVFLWLLPFTYLPIIRLWAQTQHTSKNPTPRGPELRTDAKSNSITLSTAWKVLIISIYVSTILLLSLSITTTALHFQLPGSTSLELNKGAYIPFPGTIPSVFSIDFLEPTTNDSTLSIPQQCHASFHSLETSNFFDLDTDQMTFVIITTSQLIFSFLGFFSYGKKAGGVRPVKICGSVTVLGLLIPALVAGILIMRQKGAVLRFMNGEGGCTFAFLGMKREVGYWDVAQELGFRVAMSGLGVS